jgi:hypothetical protein
VAGAKRSILDGESHTFTGGGSDRFCLSAQADYDHAIEHPGIAPRFDYVADDRPASEWVRDLRQARSHASTLAGGHDDRHPLRLIRHARAIRSGARRAPHKSSENGRAGRLVEVRRRNYAMQRRARCALARASVEPNGRAPIVSVPIRSCQDAVSSP